MAKKNVYFFGGGKADGNEKMKELLGGKGANLAEMCDLGIPVPAGFTITTEMCVEYYKNKGVLPKAERDQTNSKEALKEFDAFFERFPDSPLAEEAKKRRRDTRDRLSESDYRVGVFYYRSRWFPGAIDRLQGVLKNDPEFTNRDGVYYYLAESLSKVGRDAEALPYLERLLNEFEKSEFLEKARARSAELKASLPATAPADPNATEPKPSELPTVAVTKPGR